MSWWNAKYTNDHGEYEITFASKSYEKTKAVEKVCQAVMDDVVKSPEDLAPFLRGWISVEDRLPVEDEAVVVCMRGFSGKRVDVVVWDSIHSTVCRTVTHWMPLPKPPEEDV